MYRLVAFLVIAGGLLVSSASQAHGDAMPSPKAELTKTIDGIIDVAGKYPGDDQKAIRREKLRELINPKFNFTEMSRRSLGANWNEITPAEQKDFTAVFSELLARTYLSKIETVKPGMISKGDTFPIEYRLAFTDGRWQVYDVVIENIGLIGNYRNEFSGIIRKEKFSGLMERLRKKVG